MIPTSGSDYCRPTLRLYQGPLSPPEPTPATRTSSGGLSLDLTLSQFYQTYIKPRLEEQIAHDLRRPRGLECYEQSLSHWVAITGDPPLRTLADEALWDGAAGEERPTTCERFVAALYRLPGRGRGPQALYQHDPASGLWLKVDPQPEADELARLVTQPGYRLAKVISQNSVRRDCVALEFLIRWAGPRTKRHKKAANLFLDKHGVPLPLPWFDAPPPVEPDEEKFFIQGDIEAMLRVVDRMVCPVLAAVSPAAWWDSFLRFMVYTGVRIGTALAAEYSWVQGNWLRVPRKGMKGSRAETFYLSRAALEAIEAIRRPGRAKIFEWPCHRRHLDRAFVRLQKLAGIPAPRLGYKFHAIRKLTGDLLFARDPSHAQHALGHSSMGTTLRSYVKRANRRAAMESIPELLVPPASGRKRDDRGNGMLF